MQNSAIYTASLQIWILYEEIRLGNEIDMHALPTYYYYTVDDDKSHTAKH